MLFNSDKELSESGNRKAIANLGTADMDFLQVREERQRRIERGSGFDCPDSVADILRLI